MSSKDFYYFTFEVDPLPHNSTKLGRNGFYLPRKIKKYKDLLEKCARQQWNGKAMDDALKVEVIFHIPRPKSVKRKYPCTKPDLDNLEKPFYDGLEGALFTNDSRIVDKRVIKQYSIDGRIELKIWKLK